MNILNVGLSSFVTGTEIAVAVMAYSKKLCSSQQVDLVTIPFLSNYGRQEDAQFIVGWGASLSTVSVQFEGQELVDEAIVDEIRSRAPQSYAIHIEASDSRDIQSFDFDDL